MHKNSRLKGRSFNVRVSFDADGEPVLGFVHGMYRESEHVTDIKRACSEDHLAIAAALNIGHSSIHHTVNRTLRGRRHDPLVLMDAPGNKQH